MPLATMLMVAEAAKELGLTSQGVRNAIRGGTLVAEKMPAPHRSPVKSVYMIAASEVERYRAEHLSTPRGWNRAHDPDENKRMAEAGYLSVTEAARELRLAPGYLARLVKRGKIAAVRKHITFIHRDTIALLKAERAGQLAE